MAIGEDSSRLSLKDSGRLGQLEMKTETLDKRLDLMALELRDLKLMAAEAATRHDIAGLRRSLLAGLATWCILLALVLWYFAAGSAWLLPQLRAWIG